MAGWLCFGSFASRMLSLPGGQRRRPQIPATKYTGKRWQQPQKINTFVNRFFFIFLLILCGRLAFSQEVKQNVVKPDWNRDRNFFAVLKQMDVSYKEKKSYYFP